MSNKDSQHDVESSWKRREVKRLTNDEDTNGGVFLASCVAISVAVVFVACTGLIYWWVG